MAVASIDLFQIIFEQILKIDPTLIAKYTAIQDQLLYLIIIPHTILLLFLFGFGIMLMHEHRGLRYLLTVVTYVFIIWSGWYGSFLIPMVTAWFYIMLTFGLFLFFISKIFHPVTARRIGSQVGPLVGKGIGDIMNKGKIIEKLEDELNHVNKRLVEIDQDLQHSPQNPILLYQKDQYQKQKHELEKEIKKLGE